MSLYLLSAGQHYYPSPGPMGDLVSQFITGQDSLAVEKAERYLAGLYSNEDWANLVRVDDDGLREIASWDNEREFAHTGRDYWRDPKRWVQR